MLLFDLHISGNALALIPLVIVFSISLVLLGVAVTAICRTAAAGRTRSRMSGMVLFGAIGGALVPFNVLPRWAQDRRAGDADLLGDARVPLGDPRRRGLGAMAAPIAALGAMSVLFVVISLRRLRFDETKTAWA